MIETLDSIFRFGAVGALLLGVGVILRAGRSYAALLISAFALCVIAYLFYSAAAVRPLLGLLDVPLRALAIAAPAFFFLSALALFADGFQVRSYP